MNVSKCQFKFIHFTYFPGYEEMTRRSKLQDEINSRRIIIANESRVNGTINLFFYQVYKQRFHDEMRKLIRIV